MSCLKHNANILKEAIQNWVTFGFGLNMWLPNSILKAYGWSTEVLTVPAAASARMWNLPDTGATSHPADSALQVYSL